MKPFLLIVFLLLVSLPLPAQQSGPPAPVGPKTLVDALAKVNWSTARGVLVTVNPQSVHIHTSSPVANAEDAAQASSPFIPELTSRGYDVRALADYFGQEVVREGSITVLAPLTMTVLNTHPGPPDLYAGLERRDLMTLFMGTLMAAQWKQIGSEEGLGRENMTSDQQAMFEYLLPNPFTIVLRQPLQRGEQSNLVRKQDQTTALSAADRDQVRLRVTMETDVDANMVQGSGHFPVVFDRNQRQSDKPYYMLPRDPAYSETLTVHGGKVANKALNRLKHGQLNLDSPVLKVAISLAPVAGKLTVGDLITRVGTAAHLEMYADRRIASLPVWVKGQSAHASDVLRALCLCVCGTFRQVGPAYLLTDDVMGIWTRRALLADWDADATAQVEKEKQEALRKAATFHAAQYLTWSDDEPIKLNADLLAQITAQERSKNWDGLSVPLTALTTDQQKFIQNAATALGKEDNGQYAVTTDQVSLSVCTWLVFVVPGNGQIVDASLALPSDLLPAPPETDLPLTSSRALLVQPADAKEAGQTVQEAKKRGFVSLWVQVPYDNNLVPLKAALVAGQKAHLPVYAVVRLLSRLPGTPGTEINIFGQPESAYMADRPDPVAAPVDWARLDTPGLVSALRVQLLAIAKLPGLAGLVLRDTAAPGFDLSLPYSLPYHRDGYGADVGYTLPERLEFLRRKGADPVDIVPHFEFSRSDVSILSFPDASEGDPLAQEWLEWRNGQTEHLLTGLYQSLHATRPGLPLMIQGHLFIPANPDLWYGSWDKPQKLPQIMLGGIDRSDGMAQSAREYSHSVVLDISAPLPNTTPADYAAAVQASLLRDGKGWDEIVLDLSDCSVDKAMTYLNGAGMNLVSVPNTGQR